MGCMEQGNNTYECVNYVGKNGQIVTRPYSYAHTQYCCISLATANILYLDLWKVGTFYLYPFNTKKIKEIPNQKQSFMCIFLMS